VPTSQPNSSSGNLQERVNFGLHDAIEASAVRALSSDARALDVGRGTGVWLACLVQHGFTNLVGVDLNNKHAFSCR